MFDELNEIIVKFYKVRMILQKILLKLAVKNESQQGHNMDIQTASSTTSFCVIKNAIRINDKKEETEVS